MELEKLKERMEYVAGQWNGEDPGRLEEIAGVALEVIEKIKEIEESLEYLIELRAYDHV